MTLDRLKTASGSSLRGEAFTETPVPVLFDSEVMKGATVLGNDGYNYMSVKPYAGEDYGWRKVVTINRDDDPLGAGLYLSQGDGESRGNLTGGTASPFFQIETTNQGNFTLIRNANNDPGPANIILAKSFGTTLGSNVLCPGGTVLGSFTCQGNDGTNFIGSINIRGVTSGTTGSWRMPGEIHFRTTSDAESIGVGNPTQLRAVLTSEGNFLLGNTTGTERLDVTGNIKASGALIGSTLQTTGQSERTQALAETTLPIALNPATVPGSIVLGTDGKHYASLKADGAYSWRRLFGDAGRTIVVPDASNPNIVPDLQVEALNSDASSISATSYATNEIPGRLFLCRSRGTTLGSNALVATNDFIGTINFCGGDGTNLLQGAAISSRVDGTPDASDIPLDLRFRTRQQGGGNSALRVKITSSGNVQINNTTGTERLSVTGNVQLTDSANSYKVGTDSVVGSRKTGWTASTGTATRSDFATGSVTTEQLAERVKALIDDLISHGLIGA